MFAQARVRLLTSQPRYLARPLVRHSSCGSMTSLTEADIEKKLRENLQVEEIYVQDTSGIPSEYVSYPPGNGSFFRIGIKSPDFKGLSKVKQHQTVNKILKEEIKLIHGLQLETVSE